MIIIDDDELQLFLKSRSERLKVQCDVCADEGWLKGEQKVPIPRFLRRSDNTYCEGCDEHMKCLNQKKRKHAYSLRFTKHGRRVHKEDVTVDMIVEALDAAYPTCPGCGILLSKTSACNELHHCGNLSVCNFCFAICDERHFDTCQRWDHDSHCNPCNDPRHAEERKTLATEKREAVLRVLSTEIFFEEAWKRKCNRPPCLESQSRMSDEACRKFAN
jgi:hypothetical protein